MSTESRIKLGAYHFFNIEFEFLIVNGLLSKSLFTKSKWKRQSKFDKDTL